MQYDLFNDLGMNCLFNLQMITLFPLNSLLKDQQHQLFVQ